MRTTLCLLDGCSAKRIIATNWKITNNINEKSWLQTFQKLLLHLYKTWTQIHMKLINSALTIFF